MTTTIIHIAETSGVTRTKYCDGTPLVPPGKNDKNAKELCPNCRLKFTDPKGK